MTTVTLKTDLQPQARCHPDGAPDRPAAARQRADSDAGGATERPFASVLADAPGSSHGEGTGCESRDPAASSATTVGRGKGPESDDMLDENPEFQIDAAAIFGAIELSSPPGFALAASSNAPLRQSLPAAVQLGTALPTTPPEALAGGTELPLDGKILPPPGQLPVVEMHTKVGAELLADVDADAEAEALVIAASAAQSKSDIEIDPSAPDAPLERSPSLQSRLPAAYGHALTQQAMKFAGDSALDPQLDGQLGNGAAGQAPAANLSMLDGAALGSQNAFHAQMSGTAPPSHAAADIATGRAGAQLADPILSSQLPLALAAGDAAADPLGERLIALATQGQHFAKLRLHPAELGALEVRIKLHDDAAAITISSPHAHVRDAIESTLPRLRELFAAQGMNLVDVDVSGGDRHAPHGGDASADPGAESSVLAALRGEDVSLRTASVTVDRLTSRLGGHRIDLLA